MNPFSQNPVFCLFAGEHSNNSVVFVAVVACFCCCCVYFAFYYESQSPINFILWRFYWNEPVYSTNCQSQSTPYFFVQRICRVLLFNLFYLELSHLQTHTTLYVVWCYENKTGWLKVLHIFIYCFCSGSGQVQMLSSF